MGRRTMTGRAYRVAWPCCAGAACPFVSVRLMVLGHPDGWPPVFPAPPLSGDSSAVPEYLGYVINRVPECKAAFRSNGNGTGQKRPRWLALVVT